MAKGILNYPQTRTAPSCNVVQEYTRKCETVTTTTPAAVNVSAAILIMVPLMLIGVVLKMVSSTLTTIDKK